LHGVPTHRQKDTPPLVTFALLQPSDFAVAENWGAVRAVHEVLHYDGYKILGKLVKPGKKKLQISRKLLKRGRELDRRFQEKQIGKSTTNRRNRGEQDGTR